MWMLRHPLPLLTLLVALSGCVKANPVLIYPDIPASLYEAVSPPEPLSDHPADVADWIIETEIYLQALRADRAAMGRIVRGWGSIGVEQSHD